MQYATNPQLELAFKYVTETSRNVFLTGKAGTGKTTFLSRLKAEGSKNAIVVAPTGVAAINAGGMTIHSFFQLPFSPFVPGSRLPVGSAQRKFQRDKIRLLQSLDLLIIDEISMVRADLLDAIDQVLRRYRNPLQPFGGLQLLLIGDLHQLAPIVKDDEWALLRDHYEAPWFFNSQALRQTDYLTIELTHIFRQADEAFVGLLNRLREGQVDEALLQTLNSRYDPAFTPGHDHYITLCSHNATARQLNQQALDALPGPSLHFTAKIEGDFPAHAYPAEPALELKEGAQVMFIKNDSGSDRRYYNGRIGTITRLSPGLVRVRCEGDADDIVVEVAEWANQRYQLDEASKQVKETVIGTFSQLPLRLAWAITIHKSQGLTFERVIIDARQSFAHGQVYVALSRCKTFEGIVLRSRLDAAGIRMDSRIRTFGEEAQQRQPDQRQLAEAQRVYQQQSVGQLFSFEPLQRLLEHLNRLLLEHERQFLPQAYAPFAALQLEAETRLFSVADKFAPQLQRYFLAAELPEQNEALQERLQKAAAWYLREFDDYVLPALYRLNLSTDNSKLAATAQELFDRLRKELLVRRACFQACSLDGFRLQAQLRLRRQQELDYKPMAEELAAAAKPAAGGSEDIHHPALYARLRQWRSDTAEAQQVDAFQVLSNRSMALLTQLLPTNAANLMEVSGIGKKKVEEYGEDILAIVRSYCDQQALASDLLPDKPAKKRAAKPKEENTKHITLRMFLEGQSLAEIAAARGLQVATLEGHLSHFVAAGELSVFKCMDASRVDSIQDYFRQSAEITGKEVKEQLGDDYSYGEIRLVQAHLRWLRGGAVPPEE